MISVYCDYIDGLPPVTPESDDGSSVGVAVAVTIGSLSAVLLCTFIVLLILLVCFFCRRAALIDMGGQAYSGEEESIDRADSIFATSSPPLALHTSENAIDGEYEPVSNYAVGFLRKILCFSLIESS